MPKAISKTPKKTKGTPNNVDVHVGQRLRVRRSLLGLSQEKVAESLGLTFQQIQKYERGLNRVSAGRLFQFSKILDVPVAYFFEQFQQGKAEARRYGVADGPQEMLSDSDLMQSKETIDLIRAYYVITDVEMRKEVLRFIRSMGERMTDKG